MTSWTQPICSGCFAVRHPGRAPNTITPECAEEERCCYCGEMTTDGIYIRIDPLMVAFPKRKGVGRVVDERSNG